MKRVSQKPSTPGRDPLRLALVVSFLAGCLAPSVSADELERVAEHLELRPGSRVADVGAGEGEWTVRLAGVVGAQGKVFATEVTRDNVEEIEKRVGSAKISNVDVILGDQSRIGLPADCCDAILLRMVYHHFQQPAAMRADLRRAMRPGARILVIETEPQRSWGDVDGDLDRGGHGIPIDDLLAEMTGDGFELVERIEKWRGPHGDPYALVFRWPGPAPSASRR